MEIKKILVFGDSIAHGSNDRIYGGWAVKLKNYFAKTGQFHEVYNLGISGEKSDQIIQRIETESIPRKSAKPENKTLLIIGITVNDTRITNDINADSDVSIDEFTKNLKKLYVIGKRNADELVFLGMTKVDERKTNPWKEVINQRVACWRNDIIKKYNDITKEYCEKENINFVNMFELLDDADLPDGLHPNEIGHEKMYQRIKKYLIDKGLIRKVE